MQLRAFEYMLAIDKAGSMNKAAEQLFISQQGLRKVVDSLETELGVQLLDRAHTGVTFTAAGRSFLAYAQNIIDEYKALTEALGEFRENGADLYPIQLCVSPYTSLNLVGRFYTEMSLPQRANISESANAEILRSFSERRHGVLFLFDWLTDSAGIALHEEMHASNLVLKKLIAARLGVLCAASSPLATHSVISIEETSSLSLATFTGGDYPDFMHGVFGDVSLENIGLSISDRNAIASFLRHTPNTGIVIDELSSRNTIASQKDIAFVPLDSDLALTVGFAYFDDDPLLVSYQAYIRDFERICKRFVR